MKKNLTRLMDQAGAYLATDHGFTAKGLMFSRVDQLVRCVWFQPDKRASSSSYGFDVLLDVGIPELAPLQEPTRNWVVLASGWKYYRKVAPSPRVKFSFEKGDYDARVEEAVLYSIKSICEGFYLKPRTPDDLYQFVKRNAESFLSSGMAAENEFKQFDLNPWNVVPRIELAGVYASCLGKSVEAVQLMSKAAEHASANGIDYAISDLRANIEWAASLSRKESPSQG